jgi:hypothetical protein
MAGMIHDAQFSEISEITGKIPLNIHPQTCKIPTSIPKNKTTNQKRLPQIGNVFIKSPLIPPYKPLN